MWHDIFFDKTGVFQWASIAAIASLLAFISSLVSLAVTSMQAKKNRKSTTLVNLRLQELKDLREEGAALLSLINAFLNKRNVKLNPNNKMISKTDPLINKLDMHLNKLSSKLYLHTSQSLNLASEIALNQLLVFNLKDINELVEIKINIDEALDTYSRTEYEEIEKNL
ncbi:hypothetical protein JDS92_26035 [Bacillus cereus group sp. N12]|uniref:hypothetical protein n=1 Tax=Bacillus cereus group sp. N12 TaxID=2794586 RepID=UPI0018F399BA|nr:hypothetical protein [Bacillus cereus group sp. N12]MBJ8078784.1 hypothetical protein [Bacillus cereus group sp. N12]